MLRALEHHLHQKAVAPETFDSESNHIRCMAHIYNLAVVDMLKKLVCKQAYEDAASAIEAQLSVEDLRDPVVALRGLIVALRSSSSRRDAFQTAQAIHRKLQRNNAGEIVGALELLLDVRTGWSSTYFMLQRALELRSSLESVLLFPEHADKLARFRITRDGWQCLQQITEILQIAHHGQQLLSADSHPTLHLAIPAIEYPMSEWEKLQDTKYAEDPDLKAVLQAGIDKLSDYYLRMEKSDAYAIAM
ncbi:hypothetical protein CALVIDRAFT_489146, partial [Calocera viscosa TUFC12733]